MRKWLAIVLALAMVLTQLGGISFAQSELDRKDVIDPKEERIFRSGNGSDDRGEVPIDVEHELIRDMGKAGYVFYYAPWDVLEIGGTELNSKSSTLTFPDPYSQVKSQRLDYSVSVTPLEDSEKKANEAYEYKIRVEITGFPAEYNAGKKFPGPEDYDVSTPGGEAKHDENRELNGKLWRIYFESGIHSIYNDDLLGIGNGAKIFHIKPSYTGGEIAIRNGSVTLEYKATKGAFTLTSGHIINPDNQKISRFRIPSITVVAGDEFITRVPWIRSLTPDKPLVLDRRDTPVYVNLSTSFVRNAVPWDEDIVVRYAAPGESLAAKEFTKNGIESAAIGGTGAAYVYGITGLNQNGMHALEFMSRKNDYTKINDWESVKVYISVEDGMVPKPLPDINLKERKKLSAGETYSLNLKERFEQANIKGGVFRVSVDGGEWKVFDGTYEVTGTDTEKTYLFLYGTETRSYVRYQLEVYGADYGPEFTPMEPADEPSQNVKVDAPIYVAQSEPIEINDKDFLGVIDTSGLEGLMELIHIHVSNKANQEKLVARLTPKSMKAIADKGLIFTNNIAQILLPPDAKKHISSDESLTISLERKDPKKQVGEVDMRSAVYVAEVKINSGDKPVTEFGGESISIQLPADDTYKLGKAYRVIVVSEDGTVEEAIGICKLENGVKVVSVPTMHLSTFILTSELRAAFKDVADDAWYAEGAKFTYERGILPGGDMFEPTNTLSRAEIVAALHRMAGKPVVETKASYTDVYQDRWYSDALNWATEKEIVKGKDDGSFGVYEPITREQFLVMLHRYADKMGIVLPQTRDIKIYEDSDLISKYAEPAIQWAGTAKLAEGANGKIMPQRTIEKSEIATVLMRFVKAYEKSGTAESQK